MALNFPDSPVAGTVFGAWRYDGTKWGAVSGVSGGGSAGDITAVLAGAGLSGGGTEGDVSIALSVPVTIARGGTNATDAATALTNLGGAPLASPVFTGDPKAPTPATADNDTSLATTAYVKGQGYQTGNQTITLSGDASGSGATAITTTLATVNANVGTFQGLTVNAKGLVTAAANQSYLTSPVNLTSQVTGTLPIANGGSGSSTAAAAPWVVRTGDTMTGNLAINYSGGPALILAGPAGTGRAITSHTATVGNYRWIMNLGDNSSEAGSNQGSNFTLARYSDAGGLIDTPLTITRSNGLMTIGSFLTSMKSCDHLPTGSYTPASNAVVRIGTTAGYYGIVIRPNYAGAGGMIAFENQGSGLIGSITNNDTNVTYNTSSDARLKEDPRSFDAGLIIDSTNVYDFAWKLNGKRAYGVFAQEAAEVYPQAITHDETADTWGVDYSMYVPVLLQEVKALRLRVAALEASPV